MTPSLPKAPHSQPPEPSLSDSPQTETILTVRESVFPLFSDSAKNAATIEQPLMTWKLFAILCRCNRDQLPPLETIDKMVDDDPDGALEFVDFYVHEDWAQPRVERATKARRLTSLRCSHLYKMEDWAEPMYRLASENSKQSAVDNIHRVCDRPWARTLMLELSADIPEHVHKNGFLFMRESWFGEVMDSANEHIKANASAYF
jgi:hypothetical protein